MSAIRTGLAFILFWLISLFVAVTIAVGLAQIFQAAEEFISAMFLIGAASFVYIVAFLAAFLLAKRPQTLAITAAVLIVLSAALLMLPFLIDLIRLGKTVAPKSDAAFITETLVPVAVMIVIQWRLTRRRWLKRINAKAENKSPAG